MKTLAIAAAALLLSASAFANNYVGDYAPGDTVDCNFGTVRPSTGASFTLAGTPAISAYKDNSTTQSTAGVTLSADFDAVTGFNHVRVTTATDGTFYAAGSFIELVITTGTVDSVSVTGQPVCSFSLNKVAALRPTTAARTLDVSAGGEAGVDWANVGSPTTTVTLSGTTVKTATDVETDTQDIQARLPAALVSGRMSSDAVAISGSTTTADNVEVVFVTDFATNYSTTNDKWQVEANVLTVEGTDATNQIRDSLVDDATRIDASALNTLSGHDPGETIMGATDLGTGAGLTTLATAAALTTHDNKLGTISNLGSGATVAANLADIEGQTDDIGTAGAGLTAADDAVMTRLGTPAGVSVSADIAEVEGETDDIGAAGAGLTAADDAVLARLGTPAGASVSADIAEVEGETDDIGAAGAGLTALATAANLATAKTVVDAIKVTTDKLDDTVEDQGGGLYGFTVAALQEAPSGGGGGPTAAQIADAVWDELQAGHTTPSTFGAFLDSSVSGVSTGGVSADDIAAAVWDLDMTAHQTQGTAGQVLGDSGADTDSVWALSNTNLNATVGSRSTQTSVDAVDDFVDDLEARLGTPSNLGGGATVAANLADIEGQTDDIGAAGAGLTAADDAVMTRLGTPAGASVSVDVAAVQADTNDLQTRLPAALVSGRIDASVGAAAANTVTASALATDAVAEVQAGLATGSDVTGNEDAILAAIATLNNLSATDVRNIVIEDQGGGITLGCALAILTAYAGGDLASTDSSSTFEDPSGSETRITGTAPSPGNRTATVTCPSY